MGQIGWTEAAERGAFTTSQVARLVSAPTSEVASWLRGPEPLIAPDYEPIEGRQVLSFDGLIEARFVAHMRRQGVPLSTLRFVARKLRDGGHEHPFALNRRLLSDGFRLFEEDEGKLVNLVNECYADRELMKPALKDRVVFQRGRASYYQPDPEGLPDVRIDPRLAFGRPVVVDGSTAVPTTKLAEAFEGEGLDGAADWFGVRPASVRQAVQFEERLAA